MVWLYLGIWIVIAMVLGFWTNYHTFLKGHVIRFNRGVWLVIVWTLLLPYTLLVSVMLALAILTPPHFRNRLGPRNGKR